MNRAEKAADGTILFFCPGCDTAHGIDPKRWEFNGNLERPTFTPSVLVRFTLYGPEKLPFEKYDGPGVCEATPAVCHSFVTDGRIRFLGDCTHTLAGQTVDLPPWQDV